MKKFTYLALLIFTIFVSSCGTQSKILKQDAYKGVYSEKPVSVLIMPPINKSTKVEAKLGLYSSLAMPLANKGYYVLPPNISLEILKEQSAYDSELFLDASMSKAGEAFGVDAVLFTIIHEWRKVTVGNLVEVKIEYRLKSTKTNEVLYQRTGNIQVSSNANTGSLVGDLVANMVVTALSKEVYVGRTCNDYTLSDIPQAKYGVKFGKDGMEFAGEKEFTVRLNNAY